MTDPFPKWARWIAQDEDGRVWALKYGPLCPSLHYDYIFYTNLIMGLYQQRELIAQGTPNPHWRYSLDWLGEDDE